MENLSQQAFLVFEKGALKGRRIPISAQSVIIGRGGKNTVCNIELPERQISRQHAEIYVEQGTYYIRDLNSKNGTYVNEQPVQGPVRLQDNDMIQIALCARFRFVGSDATLPLEDVVPSRRLRLDQMARRVWIGSQEVRPPLLLLFEC